MSDGLGRGGSISKRSPPRRAEDQDSTVVLRSTRGTGLPPRILSSGRGRGAPRGSSMRAWPVVRPQSGSVPPWANRERPVDTYIPSYAGVSDGGRVEDEVGGRRWPRKEPPTQPKWDRERSRTPVPRNRMMSSSPPSGSRPSAGHSSGYSAGPSHHWNSAGDQAGPSKYSVPEPQEELEQVTQSRQSSPSTSKTLLQPNPNLTPSTSDIKKSFRWETDPEKPGHLREVSQLPTNLEDTNTDAIQDEKEDIQMDTPGSGPSSAQGTADDADSPIEKDVKPDLSALEEEDTPAIPDEDREDGVLAVKRSLVLQCYEKNAGVRTVARKAFRVQKTAELAAMGRIVQHVLWRDDGVGVQWKKARNTKSPKKTLNIPANMTSSTPIAIEASPPRRLPTPSPAQYTYAKTPSISQPNAPERAKTPPPIVKSEPSSSKATPPRQIALSPKLSHNPPTSIVQSGPVPSTLAPAKSVVVPDDSSVLSEKQKGKRPAESDTGSDKRKAAKDSPALESSKPAKLPKIDAPSRYELSSQDFLALSKPEKKALTRRIEAERRELVAQHGADAVDFKLQKKPNKSKSHRKKDREKREREEKKQSVVSGSTALPKTEGNSGVAGASTSANAIRLPEDSARHPANMPERVRERDGKGADKIIDKEKGNSKEVIYLSSGAGNDGSAKAETSKGKGKGKASEIVDLTKDSSNDKAKPPTGPASMKVASSTGTASKPAALPVRPPASKSTASVLPAVRPHSTIRPPAPAPTSARPAAPPRPNARPPSNVPIRPPPSNPFALRPSLSNGPSARPPPNSSAGRPPSIARPLPVTSAARPPPSGLIRPPLPRPTAPRPPSGDSSDIARPSLPPQYQAPVGQSSYSERQALAALARPPAGQPIRPIGAKFLPRTAAATSSRPPASNGSLAGRPPAATESNQTRSLHRSSTLSSSSPLGGSEMLPSRSLTPAITTPRYKELRRALSEKMEEMDNWTSMLVDLPDRAEMTQRQIDRTRQECFVLQKQMRDEKDKAGS